MSTLAVTTSWAALDTLTASALNTNFSDIVTYINNRNSGSAAWELALITSTTSTNPLQVSSNQASTEVSINNSATDGDPILTFKLSGTQIIVMGVDDSDSDLFKIATTGITTGLALQIPTTGAAVQFTDGTLALPGISFYNDTDCGLRRVSANRMSLVVGGADKIDMGSGVVIADSVTPSLDNTYTSGSASFRWSDLRSVKINGADIGFANSYILREFPCGPEDIAQSPEWMKTHAYKGIQVLNDLSEVIAIIGRNGTIYAKDFKKVADFSAVAAEIDGNPAQ